MITTSLYPGPFPRTRLHTKTGSVSVKYMCLYMYTEWCLKQHRGLPWWCCQSWVCGFYVCGGHAESSEGSSSQGVCELDCNATKWSLPLPVHVCQSTYILCVYWRSLSLSLSLSLSPSHLSPFLSTCTFLCVYMCMFLKHAPHSCKSFIIHTHIHTHTCTHIHVHTP